MPRSRSRTGAWQLTPLRNPSMPNRERRAASDRRLRQRAPACTRIARGVHPDVLIVEPGDNGSIKIDQVRDVVERAAYRPFEGRRRVVIIDEADALVPAAQNALLKTLEEPPSSSVFMLVTARPDVLLPTVRSRCPRLRFRPLGRDDVAAALVGARARARRRRAWRRRPTAASDGARGERGRCSSRRATSPRACCAGGRADDAGGASTARRSCSPRLARAARRPRAARGAAARDGVADARRGGLATSADARALANPDVQPAIERLSAYQGERGIARLRRSIALMALESNAARVGLALSLSGIAGPIEASSLDLVLVAAAR